MPKRQDLINRRDFLKTSSLGTLASVLQGEMILIEPESKESRPVITEAVNCALIGYGLWGREISATLSRLEEANLLAVCDNYPVMLQRAQRSLPNISTHTDYREILDRRDIPAIFIATPTHLHKQIAVDALQAGKHVYCEAPLAASVDDARQIATAARDHEGQIFQGGLLYRTEPQYRSVYGFILSGALGKAVMARAQWHARESWYRTSPNRDRTEALNWRLDPEISPGLVGEIGIQQYDTAIWIFGSLPRAVSGFGGVYYWEGRDVADTVQTVMEFPTGERMIYDATIVSSFDAMYDTFYGSDSTIILRDGKAWMFKEVDAPMLGWEVYARKDKFYKETGIALLANATKLDALGQSATDDDPDAETPLFHALKAFLDNYFFGPYEPVMDYQKSFDATVVALKANEAVVSNTRIEFQPDWFEL
ncbi:MAG: hypothetical protein BMS9Abin05_0804 [Rhodothermia bacterium]|nr:MAG: hypothetical protein BMS9Abin05_0804 [Rhodothermia bacterium]